jgi:hypothetical protein
MADGCCGRLAGVEALLAEVARLPAVRMKQPMGMRE